MSHGPRSRRRGRRAAVRSRSAGCPASYSSYPSLRLLASRGVKTRILRGAAGRCQRLTANPANDSTEFSRAGHFCGRVAAPRSALPMQWRLNGASILRPHRAHSATILRPWSVHRVRLTHQCTVGAVRFGSRDLPAQNLRRNRAGDGVRKKIAGVRRFMPEASGADFPPGELS